MEDKYIIVTTICDKKEIADKNADFLEKVKKMEQTPILLVINKIDLIDQEKLVALVEYWEKQLPNAEIIPCSALNKFGICRFSFSRTDGISKKLLFWFHRSP